MKIGEILALAPVVPVLTIERVEDAVPLARALVAGGLTVLEITLRTEAAIPAVAAIRAAVEGAVVGVGTLTRPADFAAADRAGARFGVSPGLTPDIAAASRGARFPLLPGVMTPTELIAGRAAGFEFFKLFPAHQAGGVGMLQALGAPFPGVTFCPTGGITRATAPDYLALANVACVGGSWVAPRDLVRAQDWAAIERLARDAAALRPARDGAAARPAGTR